MRKRVLVFGREHQPYRLLPPTGGENIPEVDRDSAAPDRSHSGRGVQDLGIPFACGRRCGHCGERCCTCADAAPTIVVVVVRVAEAAEAEAG
jgi:hypothetical protein